MVRHATAEATSVQCYVIHHSGPVPVFEPSHDYSRLNNQHGVEIETTANR